MLGIVANKNLLHRHFGARDVCVFLEIVAGESRFASLLLQFFFQALDGPQVLGIGVERFLLAAPGVEVFIVLVGAGFHVVVADGAGALEDGLLVEFHEAIDILPPVVEGKVMALLGAEFGLFEEDDHEAVEGFDFVFGEVVLGDDDVVFAHAGTRSRW